MKKKKIGQEHKNKNKTKEMEKHVT